MKESELLSQVKWLFNLLEKRLPSFTWTRIHVMPVLRGRRPCRCGVWHPVLSKNKDMIGHSDIWVVYAGRIGFIELKATRGKLEQSQEAFRDRVTQAQAKYHQARTLESVADFLSFELEVPVERVVKIPRPKHASCDRGTSDSARGVRVPSVVRRKEEQQLLDLGYGSRTETLRGDNGSGEREPGSTDEGDPGPG